ncbi:Alcohol dehydrogenase-like 7 [Cardamine amara subsp. amara]|uniref:Alcohol dehydrogenase-like 7 n=1 Tax=Cardamine amara subsp. amara TaxID=228776 RepID=A0ABD0ZRS7_CARAN
MENGNSSGDDKSLRKPIRCKAAVCRKAGEPLVMEEIMVAPPQPYEVRIRIICTALCHSDITFWKLQVPPACFPRILGHEAIGLVYVNLSQSLIFY